MGKKGQSLKRGGDEWWKHNDENIKHGHCFNVLNMRIFFVMYLGFALLVDNATLLWQSQPFSNRTKYSFNIKT